MKKDKGKKSKKDKDSKDVSSGSSPLSSLSTKGSRSSIFSTGRSSTTLDLPNTLNSDNNRPMSMASDGDLQQFSHRQSFQSARSSGLIDSSAQQISVQQAKKRWWNPKRKEATSLHRVSTALSISDQDRERYLNTLLQSHDLANTTRADDDLPLDTTTLSLPETPVSGSTVSSPAQTAEIDVLGPCASSPPSSILEKAGTQEPVRAEPATKTIEAKTPKEEDEDDDSDVPIAPMPKPKVAKVKSSKPKLMPISTPLAQLLELSNAEELWQYVQQAKTYATTRMNKGDKRSAAIALKRAQSLEARWQEILLEMASSDGEDDELLSDDDDMEDDEEDEESEEEVKVVEKKPKKATKKEPLVKPAEKAVTTAQEVQTEKKSTKETDDQEVAKPASTVVDTPITINTQSASTTAGDDEDSEIDADEERKALGRKIIVCRSDNVPDKYSKYKAANKSAPPASPVATAASSGPSQPLTVLAEEEAHENDEAVKAPANGTDADGRLGPEATLAQMLESSSVEDLQFYMQRLKTATVAKARSGDKFAALEGMKNVKVLQQRLEELEEEEEEEDGEQGDDSDKE